MSSARDKGLIGLLAVGLIVLIVFCGTNLMFWNNVGDALANQPQQARGIDLITDDCTFPVITTLADGTSYVKQENVGDGLSCNDKCLSVNSTNNECVGGECSGQCGGECPLSGDPSGCPDITVNNVSAIYGSPSNLSQTKICMNGKCWYVIFTPSQSIFAFLIGAVVDSGHVSIEVQRRLSSACMDLLDRSSPGVNSECLVGSWMILSPGTDACLYTYGCSHFADFAYSTNPDLQTLAIASGNDRIVIDAVNNAILSGEGTKI